MMRAFLSIIVSVVLAGCATTQLSSLSKVYDRKYNVTTYVAKQADSEFVGTSANAVKAEKAKPGWYRYGHP